VNQSKINHAQMHKVIAASFKKSIVKEAEIVDLTGDDDAATDDAETDDAETGHERQRSRLTDESEPDAIARASKRPRKEGEKPSLPASFKSLSSATDRTSSDPKRNDKGKLKDANATGETAQKPREEGSLLRDRAAPKPRESMQQIRRERTGHQRDDQTSSAKGHAKKTATSSADHPAKKALPSSVDHPAKEVAPRSDNHLANGTILQSATPPSSKAAHEVIDLTLTDDEDEGDTSSSDSLFLKDYARPKPKTMQAMRDERRQRRHRHDDE
jgi:hypothetical protein